MVVKRLIAAIRRTLAAPRDAVHVLRAVPEVIAGAVFARHWRDDGAVMSAPASGPAPVTPNPLREFFESRTEGAGVWKWQHYFEIYHRHLEKFVGRDAHLCEIGVYSGGSLDMWREYLGARSVIHGVDIAPECRAYARENVVISIGDQEDRAFWASFRARTPALDIVIDDGGHTPEQQMVTLEELLPHLRPGGVFLCEDVHGVHHRFAAYVSGIVAHLNGGTRKEGTELAATPSPVQRGIYSVHFYPYVVVIERTTVPPEEFVAPKHGTDWQPFPV